MRFLQGEPAVTTRTDRRLIYVAAFTRAVATGMTGVLLGLHLTAIGFSKATMGWVISAGIAGVAAGAALVTFQGDRVGRRRSLIALALVGGAATIVAAGLSTPWAVGLAAFVGMLNGMGRDRGPALILEQALLPSTSDDANRTRIFAWYNVLQDAGHALGGACAGLPVLLERFAGLPRPDAFRVSLAANGALTLLSAGLYLGLTEQVERHGSRASVVLSRASRRILVRISALFALDSLGGGFLTASLIAVFFHERFGVEVTALSALFAAAKVLNALSHFGAAWLARRIGLVNTMVFTHIPSSLLLVTVAIAPNFPVAAALFLLREGLVEMDVPTRQSYVMAVVRPEERTVASGVTHLVRVAAWAAAPAFAGALMQGGAFGTPLVMAAAMKIAYDVLLWLSFRRVRPPEEGGTAAA